MTSGGSRNRSGPKPNDTSLNAAKRGLEFLALPAEGYDGEAPEFPLQPIVLFTEYFEGTGRDRTKVKDPDEGGTDSFREREAAVWAEVWRTPQASAWALEAWRWPIVAEYCRLKTVIEFDPSKNASLVGQLHRYRDQIGMTPAGLKENGWKIAAPDVPAKATGTAGKSRSSSRARLKVVGNDG